MRTYVREVVGRPRLSRKEVALGRLRTLTVLVAFGAWGAAMEGALADGPAQPAGATSRRQPPAPPSEYIKAGIKLYNTGDPLAAKYFEAANTYRDMLSPAEQQQLDGYLARMTAAPTVDPAVTPASATVVTPSAGAPAAPATAAGEAPRGTTDAKQQARWMLQSAREQARLGHYDDADKLVERADSLGIKWGLFDDTPTKVRDAIAKVRPKTTGEPAAAVASTGAHDLKEARSRLQEGRAALAAGQFEQAEAIALEVNSWNLRFGVFEDSPSKLGTAARALRRRESVRKTPAKAQPSQGVYAELVGQARTLLAAGQFDQAEAKAKAAMGMNVVPPLTADRAEDVIHAIEMAKARTPQTTIASAPPAMTAPVGQPVGQPIAEPASVVAEREGNELLAKNDTQGAAAKFALAEKLHSQEATGLVDANVRKVDGGSALPGTVVTANEPPAPIPAPVDALPAPEVPAAPGAPLAPPVLDAPKPAQPAELAPPALGAPAPVAAAAPAPAPAPAPAKPANKGEEMLTQAKALMLQGNYPAAKKLATDAKAGKFGVEPQADDLLAAIALSEQGGTLSVYEAALDALRKQDTGRARLLLTEVQASGLSLIHI